MSFMNRALALIVAFTFTTSVAFGQEQTVVVQSQGSPTATWNAIETALQSVATTGGEVLFVDPLYEVDAPFTIVQPQGRFRLATGTPQVVPVVRYVGGPHQPTLLHVVGTTRDVTVEELEFDGDRRVAILLRIEKNGAAGEHVLGSVLVRGCTFRNGRQRIWDEGGTVAIGEIEKKWGHEPGASGVYVRGAFAGVTLQDSLFEDFGHVEVPEEPNPKWTAASRGAWVSSEGDPYCGTSSEYTERPRAISVLDCTFRAIRSKKFQHVGGGILVPTDADGLHLSALRSTGCGAGQPILVHRAAHATVRGCVFEHCEYRSIKLQLQRAIVHENVFLRTTNGQCEVDAQWGGAQVSHNLIQISGSVYTRGGGLIQASYQVEGGEPFVVTDNIFAFNPPDQDVRAVGLASHGPNLKDVVVADNSVIGIPRSFLFFWQPPAGQPHPVLVAGNEILGFADSFVQVGSPASGATVGGSYVGNIAKIPGVQAQQNFTPTVWVSNLGISHPVVF